MSGPAADGAPIEPPARPSPETIAAWRADPSSVPRDMHAWAREHLGFRGALVGPIAAMQPQPFEHQNDRYVIERELDKEGWPVKGLTTISQRVTPGEPLTGDGRRTTVYFPIDQFGKPIDRRTPSFLRANLRAVAIVRVTIEQQEFRWNLAEIEIWDTYKRRVATASSQSSRGGPDATVSPYEAVRRALHAITDDDGQLVLKRPLPIVMEGTITTQPEAARQRPEPDQTDEDVDPANAEAAAADIDELFSDDYQSRQAALIDALPDNLPPDVSGNIDLSDDAPSDEAPSDEAPSDSAPSDDQTPSNYQTPWLPFPARVGLSLTGVAIVLIILFAWPGVLTNGDDTSAEPSPTAGPAPTVSPAQDDATPPVRDDNTEAGNADAAEPAPPVADPIDGGADEADEADPLDAPPIPTAQHVALGIEPTMANSPDPQDGQTGSNDAAWTPTPEVELVDWSAYSVEYVLGVFAQLFGNTSYPCGSVTETYRVDCPVAAAEIEPGEFVVVTATMAGAIEPGPAMLQYGLAFDSGDPSNNYRGRPPYELDLFNDTEIWYRLEIAPDGEHVVYADGFRDGIPNYPRHSSALVITFTDTIVWVIPRGELPDGELRYRLTTFRNEGSQLEPPDPSRAGGDVSGTDVSTLEIVPEEVLVAELGPGVPPDTSGAQERLPAPNDDGQTLLIEQQVLDLQQRWNAAFATEDVDTVIGILHPIAILGSADGCRAFVERTFPLAQQITLGWTPSDATLIGGFVGYVVDAVVTYPTGTNEYPISVVVGDRGELAPVFSCDQ